MSPRPIEVTTIAPDTWAKRIGLQAGDMLRSAGGATLYSMRDFVTVQRIVKAGTDIAATWAHNGERLDGAAVA